MVCGNAELSGYSRGGLDVRNQLMIVEVVAADRYSKEHGQPLKVVDNGPGKTLESFCCDG